MGNKASKVARNGRVLAKHSAEAVANSSANSTRPDALHRTLGEAEKHEGEQALADRLKKLGQVQYKQTEEHFKPASEDKFTLTLEARQRLADESALELEKTGARKLLPSTTISAILQSINEGESTDRIMKTYKLDASVLPKLQYLSIPQRRFQEGQSVPNQLLNSMDQANRQPVRRKRKEST